MSALISLIVTIVFLVGVLITGNMTVKSIKKLVNAAHEGDVNTPKNDVEIHVCCVCSKSGVMMRCGKCKIGRYCSKLCQKKHFPSHTLYYNAISNLEEFELRKLYRDHTVREEQIDSKIRRKLIRLIGEKPMLKCRLGGKNEEVLWDTGSMISLVDTKWVKKQFPDKMLHSVDDFLENEVLQIQAANSSEISFEGVMLSDFCLQNDSKTVTVPFLVTSQEINERILGYNVIEYSWVQCD